MKPSINYLLATLVLSICLAAPALAGPFEDGVAAYDRKDYAAALWIFRPLAEQGNASAQNNLGVMYAIGNGIPQDYVEAHKWANLAAAQGNKVAEKFMDSIAARMTSDQIAEAQRLAREWKPKK
jgi:TPR repeat protein